MGDILNKKMTSAVKNLTEQNQVNRNAAKKLRAYHKKIELQLEQKAKKIREAEERQKAMELIEARKVQEEEARRQREVKRKKEKNMRLLREAKAMEAKLERMKKVKLQNLKADYEKLITEAMGDNFTLSTLATR